MSLYETEVRPMDEATMKAMERAVQGLHSPLPRCRCCGYGYCPVEEASYFRRRWCYACEARWLEARFERMVRRIGRKAALMAIRGVTS